MPVRVRSAVARKAAVPVDGARTTRLAALPSWPSAETERTPWVTVTLPVKVLVPESTRVPAPILLKPVPDRTPENSSPWVTLEREAVETLKLGVPVNVTASEALSP